MAGWAAAGGLTPTPGCVRAWCWLPGLPPLDTDRAGHRGQEAAVL